MAKEERRMLVSKTSTVYPGRSCKPARTATFRAAARGGRDRRGREFVEPGDIEADDCCRRPLRYRRRAYIQSHISFHNFTSKETSYRTFNAFISSGPSSSSSLLDSERLSTVSSSTSINSS